MSVALLFGLGNPGKRYDGTRHNVGWQVLQALARAEGAEFRPARFFQGDETLVRLGDRSLRLVLPTTFMNVCGPALVRACEVYEVEAQDRLVVLDDFMLPFGRLRFREGGSSGGHNGLKSIEAALGSPQTQRLRVGIGPVPPLRDPAGFVLEPYDAEQRKALPEVLGRAVEALRTWVAQGLAVAANKWNGGEPAGPG